jgi:uncharacterized membrane-anchored protein YitT (DUF2179 family)
MINDIYRKIIIQYISYGKPKKKASAYSAYEIAKGSKEFRKNIWRSVKNAMLIIAGIFSAAFGLKSFLLPDKFIDGSATGISLLITELTKTPLSILLVLVNIPFVLLGYKTIGKKFTIKTMVAISGLALVVGFVHFPEVTHEKLLVAVFGGFFLGAGIGLSIRDGAVMDGTEVLAIFLSRKVKTSIGDVIIIINIIIFSFAAYFLSIDTALYSMITYLTASKALDFVIEGIEEYTGVTIISIHSEKIKKMIIEVMGRGGNYLHG